MKTNIVKLKGGATLLHTRVKGVTGIYAEFSFKAGSATDPKGKLGVAHFAEHALCEFTTTRFTTEQIQKYRTKFNMTNGATSPWFMRLVLACTKDDFADACDFKLAPIKEIVFNEKDFAWQHDIIKSEIVTRTKTNKMVKNIIYFTKYLNDKKANRLIDNPAGNEETLENIKLEDLKKYIKTYCTLNNLTISVAGNITLAELKKVIKNVVYKYVPEGKVEGIKEPNGKWNKPNFFFGNAVEPNKAILAIQTNIRQLPEFLGLKEASTFAIASHCFGRLVFRYFRGREGLCYSCGGGVFNNNHTLLSELNFNLEEGNIQKVLDLVPNFIHENPDLDKQDFKDSKRQVLNSVSFDTEDIECISSHGKYVKDDHNMVYGDKYNKERMRAIKAVTYEDVNEIYRQIFTKKPYILIISNDEKWKDFDYKGYCKKLGKQVGIK